MKTAKYFSATWCGPCQTFKPIMNEIKSEGSKRVMLERMS